MVQACDAIGRSPARAPGDRHGLPTMRECRCSVRGRELSAVPESDETSLVRLLSGGAVGASLIKEETVCIEASSGDSHPEQVFAGVGDPEHWGVASAALGVKKRRIETGGRRGHGSPPGNEWEGCFSSIQVLAMVKYGCKGANEASFRGKLIACGIHVQKPSRIFARAFACETGLIARTGAGGLRWAEGACSAQRRETRMRSGSGTSPSCGVPRGACPAFSCGGHAGVPCRPGGGPWRSPIWRGIRPGSARTWPDGAW